MELQNYTFEIRGVGAVAEDVSFQYGQIKRTIKAIGFPGGSVFVQRMEVPETLTVRWTTTDGQRHEVTALVRPKVPADIQGMTVSAQLDGPTLRVFLESQGGGAARTRTQIYP